LDGCLKFIPKVDRHAHFISFDHQTGKVGPCSSPSKLEISIRLMVNYEDPHWILHW